MAQGGNPNPDQLWSFGADEAATVNDVAIDADGKIPTAVQADGSAVSTDDEEVFAWNVQRSPDSSTPVLRVDPSPGIGDPEGLGVVAIEANPGGKGDFIAVGNEGSSDNTENNVHVYRRSSGPGSGSNVTYAGDRAAPDGAVQEIWFLDRDTMLVEHEDALSLFESQRSTVYEEVSEGRWTDADETILDVDASRTSDRIALLTGEQEDQTSDVEVTLRLFETNNGALESIAGTWTVTQNEMEGHVALSDDGDNVLVGTSGNTIYYTGLHDNGGDEPGLRFSEFPWSTNGPADVSEVATGPDGAVFAAGFDNAQMFVYERTNRTDDGPRAERAFDRPIDTGQPVQEAAFADGSRTLYALGAGLMAFHEQQFQPGEEVRPLWMLPNVNAFAASEDAQRITVASDEGGDGVVNTYERSYGADVSVDVPDSVEPGRSFNVSATIQNQGSSLDRYRLSIPDLDGSWTVEAPEDPLELLPGETGNTTLTVTPSSTQAPGEVTFTVDAVSQESPAKTAVGSQQATLTVRELHAAGLEVDTSQRSIGQGNSITLEPEVTNAGNTREPITLRVGQDAAWTVSIDGDETSRSSTTLDAGGSQDRTVTVSAPSDAAKGTRNTFTLSAQPQDGGTSERADVAVVVEPSYGAAFQVPTETVDVDPGQTVNTEVTIVNDGNTRDTFTVNAASEASNPQNLWGTDLSSTSITLDGDGEETITVTTDVPRQAQPGETATVTLEATSSATGDQVGEASYELAVPEETEDSPTSLALALAAVGLAAVALRRRTR
ncbi:hypothetical protein BRD56_13000 [Thermoplasmatales archaeon SW_10_69_26]|nr:MAG: hypothetical protein BRD56_13000 [Thermoplasmatales archaeon SW_10_69_26]